MLAGAKRQAPAGGQVEQARLAPDLGQHGGKAAAAKPFLEHPEGVGGPGHADDDQAARVEAEAFETGAIGKPGFARGSGFDDPEDGAIVLGAKAREDGSGEAGHGGGVAAFVAAHLVEGGTAKAAGKHAVKVLDGEGEDGSGAAGGEGGRGTGEAYVRGGWDRLPALPPDQVRGLRHVRALVARNKPAACFVRFANRSSPLQLGDPVAQAGKAAPCHENARAHGFQTRRYEYVPALFY